MLKKALTAVAVVISVVVVGVAATAATKPDTFKVQRTASVKATPDKLFALVQDFHNWTKWSPYEKYDKNLKRTYTGPASGKGAIYEWEGNDQVGKGRMEILDVSAPNKVTIKLDFMKPFEAHNTAEFTMVSKGDTSDVTWAMSGPQPYMAKVMCVFMDMDSLVGKDFAEGLANMKAQAEKG